jgi:hypothetical protein
MNEQLERDLRTVLGDIVARTPQASPRPDRLVAVSTPVGHRRPLLAVAVGLTIAAGVAGLIALNSTTTAPVQLPPTDPAETTSTTPQLSPVIGTPTCGVALTVNVVVPNATSGPINGPAPKATQPAAAGQFIQYWTVSGGTIEIRWPADHQPLYASDRTAPDTDAVTGTGWATAQDGSTVEIKAPEIDPASHDADTYTVVMTRKSTTSSVQPCDKIQVRTIQVNGSQSAIAFDTADFNKPTIDLNALVRSSQDVPTAPITDNNSACPEGGATTGGGSVPVSAPSGTPSEALRRFLDQPDSNGLGDSGYDEYHVTSDDSYVYQRSIAGSVVNVVTVARIEQGWQVQSCKFRELTPEEQQAELQRLFELAAHQSSTTIP